jgi:hypothetical protein
MPEDFGGGLITCAARRGLALPTNAGALVLDPGARTPPRRLALRQMGTRFVDGLRQRAPPVSGCTNLRGCTGTNRREA